MLHLNEVIIGGLITVFILLMNVALKYYTIYRKGLRISNLVVVKFTLRLIILSCLILIILFSLQDKSNLKRNSDANLFLYLSISENQNKSILNESTTSKLVEIATISDNENIGFVFLDSNKKIGHVLIPTTKKSTFINLIRNNYFKNKTEFNFKKINFDQIDTEYMDLMNSDLALDNTLVSKSNRPFLFMNYLTNVFEIPSLKFYLLILSIVFVSADLIFKVKILKI
jgi:hypothetical protein